MLTASSKLSYKNLAPFLKFSFELIVFLVIFTIIGHLFYNFYLKELFSNDFLVRQEETLKQKLPEIKNVFLGDSHTQYAINTNLILNSFNYASENERYTETYYKLKHLLRLKPDIKTVFLQYDWLELVRPHRDWLELFFWKDLIDPWELDLDAKSFLYYSLIYKVLLPMAPYTSSFNMISTCKFNKNHPRFGRAFIPKYGQISLSEQQLLKRIKTQFGDGSNPVLMNRLELTHFFKMLELLKQHKVRTCLIKYPLGKPYYHAVSSLSGFEAYEDTLEMVKKAYDIEVLDYSRLFFDLPCDNYNCQRLHDFDHVDAEGADIVSRLVGSNLL